MCWQHLPRKRRAVPTSKTSKGTRAEQTSRDKRLPGTGQTQTGNLHIQRHRAQCTHRNTMRSGRSGFAYVGDPTNPPSRVGDGMPAIMGSFKRRPLMSRPVAERKSVGVLSPVLSASELSDMWRGPTRGMRLSQPPVMFTGSSDVWSVLQTTRSHI
jgi:hypothetical protein